MTSSRDQYRGRAARSGGTPRVAGRARAARRRTRAVPARRATDTPQRGAPSPAYLERFERPPHTVWLRFDQGVRRFPPNSIVVQLERHPRCVPATRVGRPRTTHYARTLRKFLRGAYPPGPWRALALDGHVVSGREPWTVSGTVAPPPTEGRQIAPSGPTRVEHVGAAVLRRARAADRRPWLPGPLLIRAAAAACGRITSFSS